MVTTYHFYFIALRGWLGRKQYQHRLEHREEDAQNVQQFMDNVDRSSGGVYVNQAALQDAVQTPAAAAGNCLYSNQTELLAGVPEEEDSDESAASYDDSWDPEAEYTNTATIDGQSLG